MEQEVIDKFEINDESHKLLLDRIRDNKFEARIAVAIIGILMTVIIVISGSILKYSRDSYKAQINRYDYNHAIDSKLNNLNFRIDSIHDNIKTIKFDMNNLNDKNAILYNRDSVFYFNNLKPLINKYILPTYKLSKSNKLQIDKLYNVIDSIKKTNNDNKSI